MFTKEVPQGTGYKTIGNVNAKFTYLDELVDMMIRQSPTERPASIEEVKRQLIGRGTEFITHQRISELKDTVIPVTEIDDPLIVNPIRLINFDWKNNKLILFLSQPVVKKWISIFRQKRFNHRSVPGKGPESFTFENDKAYVNVSEDEVQRVIDYFKVWLPVVNQLYEKMIRQEQNEEEARLRRENQMAIVEQERRERILKNTRI
jgi:hypothetical protein